MHLLTFNETTALDCRYSHDIERIVQVCRNAGYVISAPDARRAWSAYSDSSCSSWESLPDDDSRIVQCVLNYCSEHSI
ncbi:hypothetical protein [Burkholderia ubonensis]|uniref:hypothetical protein n=1 Tax=Burkholderia ubonensis TaxID=101571 RepID=UPI00076BECEE|nr:hypothetical protein [Burkholderia ubonensis]KVP17155.1 hypothetical protein WJ84_02425 [Burkholderia ubonensis]